VPLCSSKTWSLLTGNSETGIRMRRGILRSRGLKCEIDITTLILLELDCAHFVKVITITTLQFRPGINPAPRHLHPKLPPAAQRAPSPQDVDGAAQRAPSPHSGLGLALLGGIATTGLVASEAAAQSCWDRKAFARHRYRR